MTAEKCQFSQKIVKNVNFIKRSNEKENSIKNKFKFMIKREFCEKNREKNVQRIMKEKNTSTKNCVNNTNFVKRSHEKM